MHTSAVRAVLMEKYSPAQANKMLCALRRTLKEALKLGLMTSEDYSLAADIKSIKGTSLLRGRALAGEELKALMDACTSDPTIVGVRDAAMLAILMVGLRRSEVVNLDLKDFNPRTRALTIRSAKGRKDRINYLPSGGVMAVSDWLDRRGKLPGPLLHPLNKAKLIIPRRLSEQGVLRALQRRGVTMNPDKVDRPLNPLLVGAIDNCVDEGLSTLSEFFLGEQAGVAPFSPHDFRRTFISDLLDAGADIVTVAQLAGHSDPSITSRYDRRGEAAKLRAIDLLNVPYSGRSRQP